MLHQSKTVRSGMAADFNPTPTSRLSLVPASKPKDPAPDIAVERVQTHPKMVALVKIAGERCSAYLAEAAVLVLVFAILDRFLMKERMEWFWAGGAVLVSLGFLVASIVVEQAVRRVAAEKSED